MLSNNLDEVVYLLAKEIRSLADGLACNYRVLDSGIKLPKDLANEEKVCRAFFINKLIESIDKLLNILKSGGAHEV